MTVQLPEQVTVADNCLWQEVGGEIVLLDVEAGRYRSLNEVASAMWRSLEECPDVAGAHARLCELYDAEPEVLRRDLASFIAQLVELGALRTG